MRIQESQSSKSFFHGGDDYPSSSCYRRRGKCDEMFAVNFRSTQILEVGEADVEEDVEEDDDKKTSINPKQSKTQQN